MLSEYGAFEGIFSLPVPESGARKGSHSWARVSRSGWARARGGADNPDCRSFRKIGFEGGYKGSGSREGTRRGVRGGGGSVC